MDPRYNNMHATPAGCVIAGRVPVEHMLNRYNLYFYYTRELCQ